MKILHINTHDSRGGAARAAYRLHTGLINLGAESKMLVLIKRSQDSNVVSIKTDPGSLNSDLDRKYKLIQDFYIGENRTEVSNTMYSFGYPGRDISKHKLVQEADVINLHMIDGILSPIGIKKLLDLGKPIVWTLHDEYGYSGGYHISSGNTIHRNLESRDTQLEDDPFHLAKLNIKDKIDLWGGYNNLSIVTPSNWLGGEAQSSLVFKDKVIRVIANPHPLDTFFPEDKAEAKRRLGIDPNEVVLLFGTVDASLKLKGFDLLMEIIQKIADSSLGNKDSQPKITALLMGNHSNISLPIPFKSLGAISGDEELRWAYSAADILLFTSTEENLSNTLIEGSACAVVPVAFDIGGNSDVVVSGKTGYLVDSGDIGGFNSRVAELVMDQDKLKQFAQSGLEHVHQRFELKSQSQKYVDLYQKLSENPSPRVTKDKGSSWVDMDYEPGPNLKEVFPEMITYIENRFAQQIKNEGKHKRPLIKRLRSGIRSIASRISMRFQG